jgi:hypothetical protein
MNSFDSPVSRGHFQETMQETRGKEVRFPEARRERNKERSALDYYQESRSFPLAVHIGTSRGNEEELSPANIN